MQRSRDMRPLRKQRNFILEKNNVPRDFPGSPPILRHPPPPPPSPVDDARRDEISRERNRSNFRVLRGSVDVVTSSRLFQHAITSSREHREPRLSRSFHSGESPREEHQSQWNRSFDSCLFFSSLLSALRRLSSCRRTT